MTNSHKSLYLEYFDYCTKYKSIYGADNTIILMMVGGFYEVYGTGEKGVGEDTHKVAQILNMTTTRKNKSLPEVNEKNPYMLGFPIGVIDKYIDILIRNNYTVILIDQYEDEMGGKKRRDVAEIISPSTYISEVATYKSNYSASLCFYGFNNRRTREFNLYYTISLIDVRTGDVVLYSYQDDKDLSLMFNNIYRLIIHYNPTEIVIIADNAVLGKGIVPKELITQYLDNTIIQSSMFYYELPESYKKVFSIDYQKEVLEKVYKRPQTKDSENIINIIEYLDLATNPDLIPPFINLIDFIYKHNHTIINHINKPREIYDENKMIIGYNLMQKLNIDDITGETHRTLLQILNNSCTSMGKRYFKECLFEPLTNPEEIQTRYNACEAELENNRYQVYREYLRQIDDIEKLVRLITINRSKSMHYYKLHDSLVIIIKATTNKKASLFTDIKNRVITINKFMESRLNFIENDNSEDDTIKFCKGVNSRIDELCIMINNCKTHFTDVANILNNKLSAERKEFFKLDYNDSLGYHYVITKTRLASIKKQINDKTLKFPKIELALDNVKYCLTSIDQLVEKDISKKNTNLRVMLPYSTEINSNLGKFTQEYHELYDKLLCEFNAEIIDKFRKDFVIICTAIKERDYACCCAYNASKYNHVKPTIINETNMSSQLNFKSLRHPIIEIINEDIQYIANDIELGTNNTNGILLYGMNSVGKSSLMKSVGIGIIMAQAGMYVSASALSYYPYRKIFTRIPSGDDIYNGKSTFVSEMTDIRNIIKQCDARTLVIGDELCAGTETISAISLVASGIKHLHKKDTNFIFATHLHELADMPLIQDIKDVKIYHLSVHFDETTSELKFDRKLKEGDGDRLYGLEVCKSLDLDKQFMQDAYKIRAELLDISHEIVSNKRSTYNSKVIVDMCKVCGKNRATETHHIRHQQEADENGLIDGEFHKNKKFNLLPLCEKCHQAQHI